MWNWYIVIETNGRGEGKGTHISVSLHWKQALRNMPSWLNSVKLELLNHREDKNHFAYTFRDPDRLVHENIFTTKNFLIYGTSFSILSTFSHLFTSQLVSSVCMCAHACVCLLVVA